MLDPKEQGKNGFGAFAARAAERHAARRPPAQGDDALAAALPSPNDAASRDATLGVVAGTIGDRAAGAAPPSPVLPGTTPPRVPRPTLGVSATDAPSVAAAPASQDYQAPLALLYERFDRQAVGDDRNNRADLHAVILARLADNRRHAEAAGWSALALERDGGLGRLRLTGVAPSSTARTIVPDWTAGVAAEALARRGDTAQASAALHVRSGMATRPGGRDRGR